MNKWFWAVLFLTICCPADELKPADPVAAINKAFRTHQLVLLGDLHGSVEEHQVLVNLIRSPEFLARVDDIVLEGWNARYQPVVDRYISGTYVPAEELEHAWRDGLAIGPVPDAPAQELLDAVRHANESKSMTHHQLRIVCGEAPVEWDKIRTRNDLQPFIPVRDQTYTRIVQKQVLAKHHKALLYMGSLHFVRAEGKPSTIEQTLETAGATTYVILPGTNVVGAYTDLDTRFVQWNWPWILPVEGTWLGQLAAKPPLMGGNQSNARVSGTLVKTGDAFLFLGPRDELKQYVPKRTALAGTDYGRETERRLHIIFGEGRPLPEFLPQDDSGIAPQFSPPTKAPR